MTDELKNRDPLDIQDIILKVETSFGIKFGVDELTHIETFGQLCDYITGKIKLDDSADCTSQQSFYKLRDAFSIIIQVDTKTITTDYSLTDLLPRQNRRTLVKNLEKHLGFKLRILRATHYMSGTFGAILPCSIVACFFHLPAGILGIIFSIGGLRLSALLGNELDLQTIGQLSEKLMRENYINSRRNPRTFNKKEIEKVLTNLFSVELGIDKSELTRDAAFN